MTVRLNQSMRLAYVRAVMDDVPKIDYEEQIRKLIQKNAVAQLPPKVRAVWEDRDLQGWVLTTTTYEAGIGIEVPSKSRLRADMPKLSPEVQIEVDMLAALKSRQKETRDELCAKIRAVAFSASTRAKLLNMLPEFEKYLPADEAAADRSLPVIANVVTDFVKAGWPKGKEPPPSTAVAAKRVRIRNRSKVSA